jgi:archaellum component FlaG (FlaF/FlaG flagellin family)
MLKQKTITIQIVAEPAALSMADRASFKIGIHVKNVGGKAIDPTISDTVLLVNGEHNYAWDLAVQNGPREEPWWNLDPGCTVTASWPLGESMFPQPGDYDVVLRLDELESAIRVRVTSSAVGQ